MFTIEQIKDAHSKVKSGLDFPKYVLALKKLGVLKYESYVSDGNTVYFSISEHTIQTGATYAPLPVSNQSSKNEFKHSLKVHQAGGSDYPTFCQEAALAGVEKWITDLKQMTCTYFDKSGKKLVVEVIPNAL